MLLCSCSQFLFSNPFFCPGAEQGPREALAPGHGQTAPWPYGALVAVRTRFFRFQAARTIKALQKTGSYMGSAKD